MIDGLIEPSEQEKHEHQRWSYDTLRLKDALCWSITAAIVICSQILSGCGKTAASPPKHDQLHWHTKNSHLILAVNGIPVTVVQGHDSDDGVKEISVYETPGQNSMEIIGMPVDPAKRSSGVIVVHASMDDSQQAVKQQIPDPNAIEEWRVSTQFRALGTTAFAFKSAEEIGDLSTADENSILALTAAELSAYERHDVESLITANGRDASDISVAVSGMKLSDIEAQQREFLTDAFRNHPRIDVSTMDGLRIVKCRRGVVVLSRKWAPIVRMFDPADADKGELTVSRIILCKIGAKWEIIDF